MSHTIKQDRNIEHNNKRLVWMVTKERHKDVYKKIKLWI